MSYIEIGLSASHVIIFLKSEQSGLLNISYHWPVSESSRIGS